MSTPYRYRTQLFRNLQHATVLLYTPLLAFRSHPAGIPLCALCSTSSGPVVCVQCVRSSVRAGRGASHNSQRRSGLALKRHYRVTTAFTTASLPRHYRPPVANSALMRSPISAASLASASW